MYSHKKSSIGGNNYIPYPEKWEFPRLSYLKDNPGQLFKGNPLKLLLLAAELDTIYNIEKSLMREYTRKIG